MGPEIQPLPSSYPLIQPHWRSLLPEICAARNPCRSRTDARAHSIRGWRPGRSVCPCACACACACACLCVCESLCTRACVHMSVPDANSSVLARAGRPARGPCGWVCPTRMGRWAALLGWPQCCQVTRTPPPPPPPARASRRARLWSVFCMPALCSPPQRTRHGAATTATRATWTRFLVTRI